MLVALVKPDRIRALLRSTTPEKLAARLGVSVRALARPSQKTLAKADTAWKRTQAAKKGWKTRRYETDERASIQKEPKLVVPGYGPQKLARVLGDVRRLRGESAVQHQEVKHTIKNLQNRGLPVDKTLFEELERLVRADRALYTVEFHMRPAETIEERLYKVKNIEREYLAIARQFNLTDRAVYTLYYSPPAGASAVA